jgi:hypothetical protein
MMAAQRNPEKRRIVGSVLSKSFAIQQVELTATERIALECLRQIASEGRIADQYEICAGIGSDNMNGGTAAGVVNRLVSKGYIEHVNGNPLQRAIWVRIISTGQVTAEPRNKAVHWRYRTEPVPSPAIHRITERNKPLASMIEAQAKALQKPVHEFLMDCVYAGFHSIMAA